MQSELVEELSKAPRMVSRGSSAYRHTMYSMYIRRFPMELAEECSFVISIYRKGSAAPQGKPCVLTLASG